jgi:uncharacterized membrane protein YccC
MALALPTLLRKDSALRFALRAIVSATIAFSITQFVNVPLHGLWAVLTAVVVLQTSAGASIRATIEYVVGTFIGAVYASLLSILIPHSTPLAMAGVLALAIGPLAYAAAKSPTFRVAPFTALIVLLLAGQVGEGPFAAAVTRLLEVAFGGALAIVVSLFVFPEGAHGLGRQQAVVALRRLAAALPDLLKGFAVKADLETVIALQNELGTAVAAFTAIVAEAQHEMRFRFAAREDPSPLSRTLLRLRHDLVIVGRAAVDPLPPSIAPRLLPAVNAAGTSICRMLTGLADALDRRVAPPPSTETADALDACAGAIAQLRSEGLTRPLSSEELEQLFALGFALEELRQNLDDLNRCVRDWAEV